jgi:hypothetical protein
VEVNRVDTLRMVEASLATPPPWMGPVNAAAQAQAPEEKDLRLRSCRRTTARRSAFPRTD